MEAREAPVEDVVFGRFRLDSRSHSLWCDGQRLGLRSRSLEVLCVLANADGKLVTKDELMARVWPGVVVEENALQVHVSALRKALGESVGGQRHIVTIPGRGYRFVRDPAETAAKLSGSANDVSPVLERPSIAVLPFKNLSGDPRQDYFADGIVEDIITALTRIPLLSVVARNSSFAYGNGPVDIRQVGQALGVRYVLEGSVRNMDTRLRVTGQLIKADSGAHLWADNFDGAPADIFKFQDELIARVVGAVLPSLERAEMERARRKPTGNLDAYDLYLRALASRRAQTREGIDEAARLLEQAMILDPTFVAAAHRAGSTWALRVHTGWTPVEHAKRESLRYLRLAAELDPNDAEALAALARIMAAFGEDRNEARALVAQAIAMSPDSIFVLRNGGFAFVNLAEAQLGLDYLRRGLQLSPFDLTATDSWSGIALALIQLEQDHEAIAAARNAVQQNPRYVMGLRALASSLALVGQRSEASTVVRQILDLDPSCSIVAMEERLGRTRATIRLFEGLRLAGLPESTPPS